MNKKALVLCALALLVAFSAQAIVTNTATPGTAIGPGVTCTDLTATGTGAGGSMDTIAFTEAGTISDVNIKLDITHTWRGDLQIGLAYTGGGGIIQLVRDHTQSANSDNYHALLDSDAAVLCSDATMCGNATAGGGPCQTAPGPTCQPNQSLNAYDGLSSPGTWTLRICDDTNQDGGALDSWAVTLDGDNQLPVELMEFSIE